MTYIRIAPLGRKPGLGTYDTFYLKGMESSQALAQNKAVVVNFIEDERNTIYLEFYHLKNPSVKRYYRLMIQQFPCGLDIFDDIAAKEIARQMLDYFKIEPTTDTVPRFRMLMDLLKSQGLDDESLKDFILEDQPMNKARHIELKEKQNKRLGIIYSFFSPQERAMYKDHIVYMQTRELQIVIK